jgi:hypothetical protein
VPPVFAPQQSRLRPPPLEERETKVLPLDSDNCTTSDRPIIDFTSAQVMARCDPGSTTRVLMTVIPRATDPADSVRALSLRFCGEVIDAEAPSGWQTGIERHKERAGVAADVRWELREGVVQSSISSSGRIGGFAVRLRGRWRRGLGFYVAFMKSGGLAAGSPHDCPYSPGSIAAAPAGPARPNPRMWELQHRHVSRPRASGRTAPSP